MLIFVRLDILSCVTDVPDIDHLIPILNVTPADK